MPIETRSFIGLLTLTAIALSGCNGTLLTRSEPEQITPSTPSGIPAPPPAHEQKQSAESALAGSPTPVPDNGQRDTEAPPPPDDIWQRIRQGYRLTLVDDPRVNREIRWFASHPRHLQRVEERARPYLYYIVGELDRRNMPMELALLPVVESAYRPFAYSPGRAAGIWQVIPSTGRMLGLKQNWWYDGRRDVTAATNAALNYLQSLADSFDGDWELALAAYNSGAGTVRKAIRKNRERGKPTDFWSLNLPRETKAYVPRLLALAEVIKHPAQYGIALSSIPNEPYFRQVDVAMQIDLALVAEMADISIDELYRLNPGFNRWATDPDGPHRIVLPLESIDGFTEKLAQLKPEQRLRWKRYKIRPGDSLGRIAQRHGTTVSALKQANKLSSNRIRAGRHLLIPLSSKAAGHYALSANQRQARLQNRKRSGTRLSYIVKPGDSLWQIARRHNVSYKALAGWNGIAPRDPLRPGQKLVIWTQSSGGTKRLAQRIPADTGPLIDTRSPLYYRVRKGDTLSHIAKRFKVSVADLKRWNRLNGKYLHPGQRLKLHLDVAEQS